MTLMNYVSRNDRRTTMEVHQLRYFCAIVQTGSFTCAAASVHVAQPSLSQQILKLEDEFGGKLFYRLPKAVRLTPLGEVFLPRARGILQAIHDTQTAIHDAQRGIANTGPLREAAKSNGRALP
jgi:LysR family hydrogen peroxide-inducible transcriptional activator